MTGNIFRDVRITLFCTLLLLMGCSSPSVSTSHRINSEDIGQKIAVAPETGVLGEAIGVELFQRGYDVLSADRFRNLFQNNSYYSWSYTPAQLKELKARGVDAVLVVKSTGYAYYGVPSSAVVKLLNTQNGETLTAVNWQKDEDGLFWESNDGLVDAAKQIAKALVP